MKIKRIKIEQLKEADYNPRELTEQQYLNLKQSLDDFGQVVPIVVNEHKDRKNVIVGGHQRVRVAKDLGMKTMPCVTVNLTVDKERELNLRLNKNTGQWDWDKLANEFDLDELMDVGFTEMELGLGDEDDDMDPAPDAELPIVAKFGEKHDAFIIVSDNETDTSFIETVLELTKVKSYKSKNTGKSHVLTAKQFQLLWKKNAHSNQ